MLGWFQLSWMGWRDWTILLSPVPSFTSDPFPTPLIYLIPYSDSFLTSYLPSNSVIFLIFISPLFCFCSSLLIPFRPTLHVFHATINHVVPFSSCSRIMCWLNLMSLRLLLHLSCDIYSCSALYLRTLLVYKPVVPVDTNQCDYFVSFIALFVISSYLAHTPRIHLRLILCLRTSTQLRFPTSSEVIGHTCWSYEWVQHISWSQVLPVTLFRIPLTNSDLTPNLFRSHPRIGP